MSKFNRLTLNAISILCFFATLPISCWFSGASAVPIQVAQTQTLMDLKTGTYNAAGSLYARSYRVVANQRGRVCIKIVNGPPTPYEGFLNITVSSVSSSGDKLLIDATSEEILINSNLERVRPEGTFHFSTGARSGTWELTEDHFQPDGTIDECLASTDKYEKTRQGRFITGLVLPRKTGRLTAQNPDLQINVRTGPGVSFQSLHYGVVGDKVTLIESTREADSERIWYKVKFTGSGVEGWIRSDSIQQ